MASAASEDRDILNRFSALRQHSRGGVLTPNKPVTLLWALERVERGMPRLTPFVDAEQELQPLLDACGTPGTAPSYAFWRLQNDGLWEVVSYGELPPRSGDKEPKITALRAHASGGFEALVYDRLMARPSLRRDAMRLLDRQLAQVLPRKPLSNEEAPIWETVRRRARDRAFRHSVLAAYESGCAVCDLGLTLMLQAAHVWSHSEGGPDSVDNGVPLCTFHHPLFDAGLFTWDRERRLVVSSRWRDSLRGDMPSLHEFAGRPLRDPRRSDLRVQERYLTWHRRHVFRS